MRPGQSADQITDTISTYFFSLELVKVLIHNKPVLISDSFVVPHRQQGIISTDDDSFTYAAMRHFASMN